MSGVRTAIPLIHQRHEVTHRKSPGQDLAHGEQSVSATITVKPLESRMA